MLSLTAYHGSNSRFNKFEVSKARVANDLYGGGIAYFTDTLDVAKSYAKNMYRRNGGEKVVYEVKLFFNNVFDVDKIYTGNILVRMIGSNVEQFARSAGLLTFGTDRLAVLSKLRSGNIELTGEQIFKGMSNGGLRSSQARDTLIEMGFDGLRYNGGIVLGGRPHSVYLAYTDGKINILKRYIISDTPVESSETNDVYHFIH